MAETKEGACAPAVSPIRQSDYCRGWDDCVEAIFKTLGERFPRRPAPVFVRVPDVLASLQAMVTKFGSKEHPSCACDECKSVRSARDVIAKAIGAENALAS